MGKTISAEEFERRFDDGEDMTPYLDLASAVTVNPQKEMRKVNVDMPSWMIDKLDREANRLGINRQAVIKTMLDRELAAIA